MKDHFNDDVEEVNLMRAKLKQEFPRDIMQELWNTFAKFNAEKVKNIETSTHKNE